MNRTVLPVAVRSGLKAKVIPTLTNKAEDEGNVDAATTGVEVGRGEPGAVRAPPTNPRKDPRRGLLCPVVPRRKPRHNGPQWPGQARDSAGTSLPPEPWLRRT